MTRAIALAAAIALAGCSLAVNKPEGQYRTGVLPDCSDSFVPPALDYTVGAASLGTMAVDDDFFCVTCPIPWIAAALFVTAGVIGTRRVSRCRDHMAQHRRFLELPTEEQDRLIQERRSGD